MKVAAIAVVAGLVLALAPVAAQVSNTNTATAGVFRTDVDNFMSVNDYTQVDLQKWFGYVGYDSSMLSLGYARNVGDMYLGAYYNGNAFKSVDPTDVTEVITTNQLANGVITGVITETSDWNQAPEFFTNNRVNVLLGVAGMGIRVGLYENLTTATGRFTTDGSFTDTNDVIVEDSIAKSKDVVAYTDGAKTSGTISPSVLWGTSFPFGEMTLKPYALIGMDFYQDSATSTKNVYTEIWGNKESGAVKTTAGKDYGYFSPVIYIGSNLDFAKEGTVQTGVGLTYGFTARIYSNTNNSVMGTAVWTETITDTHTLADETKVAAEAVTTVEKSEINNYLYPQYTYTKDLSDRVSIGLIAKANVSFSSLKDVTNKKVTRVETYNAYTQDPADDYVETRVETIPGNTVETTKFGFSPYLQAGLTFDLVPGVFVLNAGLNVNLPAFSGRYIMTTRADFYESRTTTVDGTGTTYHDTSILSSTATDLGDDRVESQSSRNDWNAMSAGVKAGFTLNVDRNIAFDALMSTSNFTVDATTFSLIFTVKQ